MTRKGFFWSILGLIGGGAGLAKANANPLVEAVHWRKRGKNEHCPLCGSPTLSGLVTTRGPDRTSCAVFSPSGPHAYCEKCAGWVFLRGEGEGECEREGRAV